VLFGFQSNEDLWNWDVSDALVAATDRVLRWWDYFEMSDATAIAALEQEIAQRESAMVRPAAALSASDSREGVPLAVGLAQ
jgi:hypothetical protein